MFNVIIAVVAVHNVQYYHYCVSISNKQEKVNMMGRRRKGTSVRKKIHFLVNSSPAVMKMAVRNTKHKQKRAGAMQTAIVP